MKSVSRQRWGLPAVFQGPWVLLILAVFGLAAALSAAQEESPAPEKPALDPALTGADPLIDRAKLLSDGERRELEGDLAEYHQGSQNRLFIRITENGFEKEDTHAYAQRLLDAIQSTGGTAGGLDTLVYIDIKRYGDDDLYFTFSVQLAWQGLEQKLINQDDHYYSRVPEGSNLVSYLLEGVLWRYFYDESYADGVSRVIMLIRRLQAQEIDSDGIATAFWVSTFGKFIKYALMFVVGCILLGFILHKLGIKGGEAGQVSQAPRLLPGPQLQIR